MPVPRQRPPVVSVVMAAHNAAPYVAASIGSVLAQSCGDLELLVSDDGSADATRAIAEARARDDARVRIIVSDTATGPAAARNRALAQARGTWIAIVDADDLIHPCRLERLLTTAAATGADIVADDLIRFGAENGRRLLADLAHDGPWSPGAAALLEAELDTPGVPVGYLKPLIRRTALGAMRYREEMTVGEDLDLLLRLAVSGARVTVIRDGLYLYRRHPGSISHRLSVADVAGMDAAAARLAADPDLPPAMAPLIDRWRARLAEQRHFASLVERLTAYRLGQGARMLAGQPGLVRPLTRAMGEAMARRIAVTRPAPQSPRLTIGDRPIDPAALVARTGCGTARLTVIGHAGLDALGYVPGWAEARLIPPPDGWSAAERARIAALPWPVTGFARVSVDCGAEPPGAEWRATG